MAHRLNFCLANSPNSAHSGSTLPEDMLQLLTNGMIFLNEMLTL
jgi:hypothetical protein